MRLPLLTATDAAPMPEEVGVDPEATERLASLLSGAPAGSPERELAPIASALLAQLKARAEVDLDATGECVALLARLLAGRAAELVAQPVDDDDADSVPARLEADPAGAAILAVGSLLAPRQGRESFVGPSLADGMEKPIAPRDARALLRAWEGIQQGSEEPIARVAVPAFVRLETALSNLVRRLRTRARESLSRLLAESNRNDAVVHFLALLELVRRGKVAASQAEPCQDIEIEWAETSAERKVRAS